MNSAELISVFAEKTGKPQKEAKQFLYAFFHSAGFIIAQGGLNYNFSTSSTSSAGFVILQSFKNLPLKLLKHHTRNVSAKPKGIAHSVLH